MSTISPVQPPATAELGLTGWAERGWVPDRALRWGIRRMCCQRLQDELAGGAHAQQQRFARARDADVGEAALFLAATGFVERALVREQAIFEADQKHDRKLQRDSPLEFHFVRISKMAQNRRRPRINFVEPT